MPIIDPNICTQHEVTCERMADIKKEMADMRTDNKENFTSIREGIEKLSTLTMEVAVSQQEMSNMRHTVQSLVAESATTKERLAAAIAERERLMADATNEQRRLEKDVTTAHDFIREIKKVVEEEVCENRMFRRTIKIYWGIAVAAAIGAPIAYQFYQWLFTVNTHLGVK